MKVFLKPVNLSTTLVVRYEKVHAFVVCFAERRHRSSFMGTLDCRDSFLHFSVGFSRNVRFDRTVAFLRFLTASAIGGKWLNYQGVP